MLRLILVRHAKSAWDDLGLTDFDRPLARRGLEAAAWIGDTLAQRGLLPERIVCSTSRRTRETLELALVRMPANWAADIVWSEAIYDRRDHDYLGLIAEQGGSAKVLMVIGHNSATEETARALASRDQAVASFPTGGIAVIDLHAPAWTSLAPGSGQLVHFLRPPKE
jgi:phosphohistidine phosphatase